MASWDMVEILEMVPSRKKHVTGNSFPNRTVVSCPEFLSGPLCFLATIRGTTTHCCPHTQAHNNGANNHVLSSPNCEPEGPLSPLPLFPEYLSPQSVVWHSISDERLPSHDLMLRGKSKKESLWEQGWPCGLITKVVAQDSYPLEDQSLPYALVWPLWNSF